MSPSSLDAVAWPSSRLGEALAALARSAGLASPHDADAIASLPPPRGALASWLTGAAETLGVDLDEVSCAYAELVGTIEALAPALVHLPSGDIVVIVGRARRGRVAVLAPDGARVRLDAATVAHAMAAPDEARIAPFVEKVAAAAHVPSRRRARAEATLRAHRLADAQYQGLFPIRASAGSSFVAQARAARLFRKLALVTLAHAVVYAAGLGAWAMLGRGVLRGLFDAAWLAGWFLLLLSAIPFRLFVLWAEGRFALGFGALLKERLLQGALNLDPETMRRAGSGELLARVLEAEAVEGLATTGGVTAILAIVEVAFVLYVLASGAGGLAHAGLLFVWTLAMAFGATRLFEKRRTWTDARLESTRELVDRMRGHQTRLAQEHPSTWHDAEDGLLERYLDASRGMDRMAILVDAILARSWLVVGLAALAPALLDGSADSSALAIGVGGVLLADRALRRFSAGLASATDAALAWRVVGPLFRAASEMPRAGVPGLLERGAREGVAHGRESAAIGARAIVLEGRDLTFRHGGRAEPVLRGASMVVSRGDRVLLEGPSGGGKSTLAAVLTGLRAPDAGLLLLHGLDPSSVGAGGWRRAVACAPQFHENHVLAGPFAMNLLLAGRWPASAGDLEEAEAVCRELGLGALLDRMPGGLLQVVGESGWDLSHGEKSRLFLARALLQRADVVVLDESFAALDSDNLERAVTCATRRAPALIVIAHP